MAADLDIAEVARRSGVPASALRFYEQKGLIASTGRRGLRRLFDPSVLERLALIALGRTAGFSLDEIARMFGCAAIVAVAPFKRCYAEIASGKRLVEPGHA